MTQIFSGNMKQKNLYSQIKACAITFASSISCMNSCNFYIYPEERCSPSGYFEGIISGGGDSDEFYSAVLADELCGLTLGLLERIVSQP